MTTAVADQAKRHLLQHFIHGECQEDLCFALWRPSTGTSRRTGLIYRVILPETEERELHGNASFRPGYFIRAIDLARQENVGLAFMHSHPGHGWQGMSDLDVVAERDVLAYPARASGLPLIGLTIGADGYWSARFWDRIKGKMERLGCTQVRIVGDNTYRAYFDDALLPPPERRDVLKRTIDTWGKEAQQNIARLKVGVVGLGSVGCIVAEALARIGISRIALIDHDVVKRHNLDRLLYASERDIGSRKVELAKERVRRHATAKSVEVTALPLPIHDPAAYKAAIDCDILFSCVDRPVGRDVLNYIAYAHLIPVIDGGVDAKTLNSAHWRAHLIGPQNQCMRCMGQYNTSGVGLELEGLLEDPSYIATLPAETKASNQNVFPFSLSVAAMEVNLLLRHLLSRDWWPTVRQQDYRFVTGDLGITEGKCYASCEFPQRAEKGDSVAPPYLRGFPSDKKTSRNSMWHALVGRIFFLLKGGRS